ncbi:MAG: hypothetical protein ACT4NU_05945 [Chromatiales bacterium]
MEWWVQALISLVTGGVAGAAVNAWVTTRKQRLEVTLSVIRDFFSIYDDVGKVKGILAETDVSKALGDTGNLLLVRRTGDWFHYVASLLSTKVVDRDLLEKVAIVTELDRFREAVLTAKTRAPQHLENAWHWWPNIENFRRS